MISAVRHSSGLRPARLRRSGIAAVLLLGALEIACSQNYRPVVQPILPPPPNPAAFHFVASLTTNGPSDAGSVGRIDVSGDTYAGVFKTGVAPAHAALTPGGTRLYVANSGEDTVSAGGSSTPTAATTISLPPGSQPVFVHSTENGNMYVANYGSNSVSAISTTFDVVTSSVSVDAHPVAMAELPNGQKLYVVNQGSGTVTSINIVGFSVGNTISVGSSPVWAVARSDSAKIYVLDSAGTVYDIDTLSESAVPVPLVDSSAATVGAGANFMSYDPVAQRLYVTNPTDSRVAILNAAAEPPTVLKVLDLSQGTAAPCPAGCSPVAVTGIGDGTRAYVASYQLATCAGSSAPCVSTQVEVVSTATNLVSKVIPVSTAPVDMTNSTNCGPATGPPSAAPWMPGTARFRAFVASSGGGSTSNFKVYVSQCDAGSVAVIDTFADNSGSSPHPADVYTVSLAAPLSSFAPQQASISSASQAAATTTSPATTTYNYTPLNSALGLQVGMNVIITGMSNSGDNGDFIISGLGARTFSVANPLGVSASSQSGSATVLPAQNPVFVVAGP